MRYLLVLIVLMGCSNPPETHPESEAPPKTTYNVICRHAVTGVTVFEDTASYFHTREGFMVFERGAKRTLVQGQCVVTEDGWGLE